MKQLFKILSFSVVISLFCLGGCSQKGCPSNHASGKGKPKDNGETQQHLFNKDMR